MTDRSARPHRFPNRTPSRTERRIIGLRFTRRWGPHRIAFHLGMARSTVGRVLARYRMPLLRQLDQATGLPVRRPRPVRYEKTRPGQLAHIDIKKQGRIPDGGGWRAHGRGSAPDRAAGAARDRAGRAGAAASRGYRYLHHAVDDHTRLAYSEILDDERKHTAAGFWARANAFFTAAGITVEAVMTDNGSCYRSREFAAALGTITHKRTRRTGRKPTARSNGSTAPSPPNGPTPAPTTARPPAQRPTATGCITTITTAHTRASAAKLPQPAFTTSRGTTPRPES